MTGYDESGAAGLAAKAIDLIRLRGRLEASPFHFINLGVLAYIGLGQVRQDKSGAWRRLAFGFCRVLPFRSPMKCLLRPRLLRI